MPRLHLSTKILAGEIIFLILAASTLTVLHYPKLLPMSVHLFLHITGAIMFIGNIVITGVWMYWAERTRDKEVITFAAQMVNWADVFFTGPGVILLLLNGLEMASHCDKCSMGLATPWIEASLTLFIVAGILWAVLIVYQNTLMRGLNGNSQGFYKTLHQWYVVGIIDTIIPLVILAFMVMKPAF